jgi:RNA polymerase sigma-70 factor (ECF subfamily)
MSDEEDQLIRLATQGDGDALTALLRQYGRQVRQSLAGKIDKRWQSILSEDDLMQETYADAFRCISRFVPEGDDAFVRWLTKLARHNLLDAVKGLQAAKQGGDRIRRQEPATDNSYVALLENIGGSITSPSMAVAREEAKAALHRAIEQLPSSYRDLVRMYDLEGRSAEEVSKHLGCSPGALYMRRARAHARLQELLGSQSRF